MKPMISALAVTLGVLTFCSPSPATPWPGTESTVFLTDNKGGGLGCVTPLGIRTAAHVVEGAITWHSRTHEGPTRVLSLDARNDLALLQAEEKDEENLPPFVMLASHPPEVEEEVAYTGILEGMRVIYHARVLGLREDGKLILDGMVSPGTSGSCVLSARGEVYAIIQGASIGQGSLIWVRSGVIATPVWTK